MDNESLYQYELNNFSISRKTGIVSSDYHALSTESFQWVEQRASPLYPPTVFLHGGSDYMPVYPDMDISSYSGLSGDYPAPPSYLESPRSVLLTIPTEVNENLGWVSPIPVSPEGTSVESNGTLCWGTPIPVSPGGGSVEGTDIPVSPRGASAEGNDTR